MGTATVGIMIGALCAACSDDPNPQSAGTNGTSTNTTGSGTTTTGGGGEGGTTTTSGGGGETTTGGGGTGAGGDPVEVTELIPLDQMTPNMLYHGQPGGLVDTGAPTVSAQGGKIVVIAISMSNGHQEFEAFMTKYEGDASIASEVELVNCAVGGSALESWLASDSLWSGCKTKVQNRGHSLDQVKVVWAKNADQYTMHGLTLPDPGADFHDLRDNMFDLWLRIADEFPSVQAVYNSSRIYGGYVEAAKQAARGEPISYEGGHATNAALTRWQQEQTGHPLWVGWGPYIWARGEEEANQSGITWSTSDFQGMNGDNQHPNATGATKVADALHTFWLDTTWYPN